MTDDLIESLGPILYAVSKSLLAYKEAYSEAATAYKDLTGNEIVSEKDIFSKILSSTINEIDKTSEISAVDFLRRYQQFNLFFSMIKKFLG